MDILINKSKSEQVLDTVEILTVDDIIKPVIEPDILIKYYYCNIYHQRAIKLKARVLSNIKSSTLDKHVKNPKEFLYNLVINLETFGNAFIEKAGIDTNFNLYNLPSIEGRVDINGNIYQHLIGTGDFKKIEGYLLKYSSLLSRFYGEPDYLSVLEQIDISKKADKYNQAFFDNGAKPSQAIIFENSSPNEKQINSFREFYGTNFKGYDNAHKTLILHTGKTEQSNAKVRIENIGQIDDLSFEKLKNTARDEIIVAHAVPPRLVGVIGAGALGGGGELMGQLHLFNQLEVQPKIGIIEEFFKSIGIVLELNVLDTTNLKSDSDIASSLVASGIISVQEAKELLKI